MTYRSTRIGAFISRPNRFIAHITLGDETVVTHVKNTGRCKELLIPGAKVVLEKSGAPNRKTDYDLVAVWKGERLINMDSYAPNKAFYEYLKSGRYIDGITLIRPEAKYGNSRFDFYVEADRRKVFIEVKGVTLEQDNITLFPDAPTERGVKHLRELMQCAGEGYEAHVVFVIQMSNVRHFAPNNQTHPAFGKALVEADQAGVIIAAVDCIVTENTMTIGAPVPVRLK